MSSLKRFFDFILFGNIYVALGAFCLVQSSVIELQFIDHLLSYSILVFFATLFVYNFQRIFYKLPQDNSLNSIRRKWIFKNQVAIKRLMLTGFIGVVITFFFYNNIAVLFYLSPLLILSLFYFLPFVKLRKSPWLKLLTLVIVWVTATAIVPLLLTNDEGLFVPKNILHVAMRFCFLMAICIPFDIRDLEFDKADFVSTVPHLLGENKARWLAFGLAMLYMLLVLLEFTSGIIILKVFIALMLSAIVSTVLVLKSSSERSEYFYVAGIDGTMILQGVLLQGVYYL